MPATNTWVVGDWLCRHRPGANVGRVNSASYVAASGGSPADFPDDVIRSFEKRDLAPRFRITPLAPRSAPGLLAAAGFHPGRPVLVMTTRLSSAPSYSPSPSASLTADATPGWRSLYLSGYTMAEGRSRLELAEDAPSPRRFAVLGGDGDTAGIGLGVVVNRTLGIFDVMTAPAHRRRGVGSRVVTSLLAWGAGSGADLAYLQVASDNTAAVLLYQRLGFTTAYEYYYFSSAGAPSASSR